MGAARRLHLAHAGCAANGVLVTIDEIVISIWRLFLPLWPIVCAAAAIIGIDELAGFL